MHLNSCQNCLQICQCRHFESCSNLGAPLLMSLVINSKSYSAFPISCFPSDEQFGATQKDFLYSNNNFVAISSAAVDGNWGLWFWYANWLPSYPFKMAALSASLWHISRSLCYLMKSSKHFVRFQMAVIETWLVKQCLQCKWSIFFFPIRPLSWNYKFTDWAGNIGCDRPAPQMREE